MNLSANVIVLFTKTEYYANEKNK